MAITAHIAPVILVGLLAFVWIMGAGVDIERQVEGAGRHLAFAVVLWIAALAAAVSLGRSL